MSSQSKSLKFSGWKWLQFNLVISKHVSVIIYSIRLTFVKLVWHDDIYDIVTLDMHCMLQYNRHFTLYM